MGGRGRSKRGDGRLAYPRRNLGPIRGRCGPGRPPGCTCEDEHRIGRFLPRRASQKCCWGRTNARECATYVRGQGAPRTPTENGPCGEGDAGSAAPESAGSTWGKHGTSRPNNPPRAAAHRSGTSSLSDTETFAIACTRR
jgi:hypothetical protein